MSEKQGESSYINASNEVATPVDAAISDSGPNRSTAFAGGLTCIPKDRIQTA